MSDPIDPAVVVAGVVTSSVTLYRATPFRVTIERLYVKHNSTLVHVCDSNKHPTDRELDTLLCELVAESGTYAIHVDENIIDDRYLPRLKRVITVTRVDDDHASLSSPSDVPPPKDTP